MAKGSIIQLSAQGSQSAYLTEKKPKIDYFKDTVKGYTPFAIEEIPMEFQGTANFGKKVSCIVPNNKGDLLSNVYLRLKLPKLTKTSGNFAAWTNSVGYAIIEYCDLEINGMFIDRIDGTLLDIFDELNDSNSTIENKAVGKYDSNLFLKNNAETEQELYVGLKFWFFKNLQASIPLVSLSKSEIRFNIKFRKFEELLHYDGSTPPTKVDLKGADLLGNFVFIPSDEKIPMYNKKQDMLITQHQLTRDTAETNRTVELNFNHPVRELFWVFREVDSEDNNDWFNYSKRVPNGEPATNLMKHCRLLVNGVERFSQNEFYFRTIQQNIHHANTSDKHLYVYSFSRHPDRRQPSGEINFSLIDSSMHFTALEQLPDSNIYIYAQNYNWLVIENGIAGIRFSN